MLSCRRFLRETVREVDEDEDEMMQGVLQITIHHTTMQ